MKNPAMFAHDVPPAVFIGVIVVALAITGWIMYTRTELPGAKNPIGAPGNVDPYLGGPNSVLRRSRAPGGGAGGAGAPGTPVAPGTPGQR